MRVAEAQKLFDGSTRYVVEYEREGQGTQRPTFTFPPGDDRPFEEHAAEMREAIHEEQRLNEPPQPARQLDSAVGREL